MAGISHAGVWGESIPSRESSKFKALKSGISFIYSRRRKKAHCYWNRVREEKVAGIKV